MGEQGDVPSVNLALPPVGWQRTVEQDEQTTTVCACENTVVMAKHPITLGCQLDADLKQGWLGKRTRALNVHEVRVGRLYKTLELVLLLLVLGRGVQQIDGESLRRANGKPGCILVVRHAGTHHVGGYKVFLLITQGFFCRDSRWMSSMYPRKRKKNADYVDLSDVAVF